MSRSAWVLAISLVLSMGCATAGGGGDDDDDDVIDSGITLPPDAPTVIVPDAPPAPDAAPVCLACTLVPNGGCAGGDACDLHPDDFAAGCTACRDVTASGMSTSTCAADTDCAAGWVCLGSSAGASCLKYCAGDGDCSSLGTGAICAIGLQAGGTPIPGASVCSQQCAPPTPGSGCPAGWGCHFYNEPAGAMRLFTSCAPPGAGGQEASCTYNEDCQAGYSCYTDGTSNFCIKNCNATTGVGCAGIAGTTCNSFSPAVVVGGVEYGYCY